MAKTTPNTTAATATKKARAPRAKKGTVQLNMLQSADDSLNDLMASLGVPMDDEVVEPANMAAAEPEVLIEPIVTNESLPEDVIAAIEAIEAEAEPDPLAQLAEDAEQSAEAEADDEVAAEDAQVKAKREAKPRKFYSDQSERLKDNLGGNLQGYMVLTAADAELDEEALNKCMDDTLALIKAMNKKEQKWAAKFIEFLAGKKSSLSEVTHRMLKVLDRDGHISMGTEGNAYKDLLSKPYSAGAARAMGGNNLGMLKDLKVVIADGAKGRYIANPDSLLLAKAKSMLVAAPAPVEA